MKNIVLTYLATLLTLCILDVFYLGGFAKNFFESQLGPGVLAPKPVWSAAVLFYLLYAVGAVYVVVLPHAASGNLAGAAIAGAVLGAIAYGTYDLTNMATIVGWKWVIVGVDVSWGIVATALASVAGTACAHALAR